ncbi:MAG: hypothetical protein KDI15_14665, partial [Thiothrix sp.]|nr:hypothetical protein [Thiothrix sp.]
QISPLKWLPWGIPQEYVVSTYRYPLSLPREITQGKTALQSVPDYPALAVLAGDPLNLQLIDREEHGAFVREGSRGYQATIVAIFRLLGKSSW